MRSYEIIFIVRPDVVDEEVDKFIGQMQGVAESAGGTVEKVERMGRRRLAYHIQRQREGHYILFHVQGTGDTVREFERRLKVSDTVMKYLTVRTDETQRRIEKFKDLRAKQESKRRRGKPAPAAAAGSSQQAPAETPQA